VVNLLNQTMGAGSSMKPKGMNAGSPTGILSPTATGNAYIKEGKESQYKVLDTQMIHLHKSSSHSVLENGGHCGSITDSEIMRGGVPLSTAGQDESEAGASEHHKERSAIKA
jgi:hypothetical protein